MLQNTTKRLTFFLLLSAAFAQSSNPLFCFREVWPDVPVLLCTYHVKQAWALNLQQKVPSGSHIESLRHDLDALMYYNQPQQDPPLDLRQLKDIADAKIRGVLDKYRRSALAFVQYFEQHWAHRPGIPAVLYTCISNKYFLRKLSRLLECR